MTERLFVGWTWVEEVNNAESGRSLFKRTAQEDAGRFRRPEEGASPAMHPGKEVAIGEERSGPAEWTEEGTLSLLLFFLRSSIKFVESILEVP